MFGRFFFGFLALFFFSATLSAQHTALQEWGIPVTSGAATGYIPDAVCGDCHQDKFESFQQVGMAKSFYRPFTQAVIEDFQNSSFFHAPSKRYYEMELRGEEYWFRRYQKNAAGEAIHLFEQKVDWILGSGHHSRVYLYQTGNGHLFQLPLAWYSQGGGKWEMAPGFEFADHLGVNRVVRRRCMACHNAFPDVVAGSDLEAMPETFPFDLPEGIGCQRCHGPGADHVEKVLSGSAELDGVRAAIVHPGKLDREELYGICYGCHMQPSVAVTPELRYGRGAYSFRPGENLQDYKTFLNIEDALRAPEDRFDINHHPFRLEQSACFIESQGELGCLTCHDPHRKVPVEQRAQHYREACLSCHATTQAGVPVISDTTRRHPDLPADGDCIACHMPDRRTQDVIHAKMTDHKIVREPGDLDALVAPLAKVPADVVGVSLLSRSAGLSDAEKVLAQATGILRHTGFRAGYAAEAMERVLLQQDVPHFEPWFILSRAQYTSGNYLKALEAIGHGLRYAADHPALQMQKALILQKLSQPERALDLLDEVLQEYPDFATARYNKAAILLGQGQFTQAQKEAEIVLENVHTHWQAHRLIGQVEEHRGNREAAIEAYLNTLRIEPSDPETASALTRSLGKMGADPTVYTAE